MKLLVYIRTVLWGFIGIGSRGTHNEDLKKVNPLGLLAVAGVLLAVFLGTLFALVQLAMGILK